MSYDDEPFYSRRYVAGLTDDVKRLLSELAAAQQRITKIEELFNGGPDTSCRTVWDDGIECVSVPLADLRDALAAPAVAPPDEQQRQCEHGEFEAHPTDSRLSRVAAFVSGLWCSGPAVAPVPEPEDKRCICPRFSDTGGFRVADLCCPIHGIDGSEPGDGPWEGER